MQWSVALRFAFIGAEIFHPYDQSKPIMVYMYVWNTVTVLCGQLDCDDGHL